MKRKAPKNNEIITVAYADDHNAVRKGIISYLHELGGINVIIEAEDGKDLIEQLAQSPEQPDVCIIDINMPRMNGFETVANIKKKWKDKKILILSTYDEEIYVLQILRAGANGYLTKTCAPDEIKKAIITIHQTGHYYSSLYLEKSMQALQGQTFVRRSNFTSREVAFMKHICGDLTYLEIAKKMGCSKKSVEGYRDNLFRKLNVNSRVSLAIFAIKSGIVLV